MSAGELRKPLEPLGSPPRVRVTKVVRTQYRVEWEYDGYESHFDVAADVMDDIPVRRRRARFTQNKATAYRMAAWRLIFARRDRYALGPRTGGKRDGCKLCNDNPVCFDGEDGPQACRYHHGPVVERLRDRLARYLRWREEHAAAVARSGGGR